MYVVDPKSLPSSRVPNVGDKVWFWFIMDATFFWQISFDNFDSCL